MGGTASCDPQAVVLESRKILQTQSICLELFVLLDLTSIEKADIGTPYDRVQGSRIRLVVHVLYINNNNLVTPYDM